MRICCHLALFAGLLFIVSCSSSKKTQGKISPGISGIRFISEYTIPNNLQFNGITVGGLSGIDYDTKRDLYYMICDDPSAISPARFYTAKIVIGQKGIDSIQFIRVDTLLDPEGKPLYGAVRDSG